MFVCGCVSMFGCLEKSSLCSASRREQITSIPNHMPSHEFRSSPEPRISALLPTSPLFSQLSGNGCFFHFAKKIETSEYNAPEHPMLTSTNIYKHLQLPPSLSLLHADLRTVCILSRQHHLPVPWSPNSSTFSGPQFISIFL